MWAPTNAKQHQQQQRNIASGLVLRISFAWHTYKYKYIVYLDSVWVQKACRNWLKTGNTHNTIGPITYAFVVGPFIFSLSYRSFAKNFIWQKFICPESRPKIVGLNKKNKRRRRRFWVRLNWKTQLNSPLLALFFWLVCVLQNSSIAFVFCFSSFEPFIIRAGPLFDVFSLCRIVQWVAFFSQWLRTVFAALASNADSALFLYFFRPVPTSIHPSNVVLCTSSTMGVRNNANEKEPKHNAKKTHTKVRKFGHIHAHSIPVVLKTR